MLAFSIFTLCAYLLVSVFNMQVSMELDKSLLFAIILIIIMTIISWILHLTILSKKDSEKYEEDWDEDPIKVLKLVYVIICAIIMLLMVKNVSDGSFIFNGTILFIVLAIITDLITPVVIYFSYSYDVKESICDSLLFQCTRVRMAIIIMICIGLVIKYTIVGILAILILYSIIGQICAKFK